MEDVVVLKRKKQEAKSEQEIAFVNFKLIENKYSKGLLSRKEWRKELVRRIMNYRPDLKVEVCDKEGQASNEIFFLVKSNSRRPDTERGVDLEGGVRNMIYEFLEFYKGTKIYEFETLSADNLENAVRDHKAKSVFLDNVAKMTLRPN